MTPGLLTLEASWALVGLLALPVLWWLHRRLARPPRVEVPSLLFFVEEPGPLLAAARRRRDLNLLLALVAATALALAAAGPVLAGATPGRSVRIVVAGGAAAQQTGYRARAEAEIAKIRAATTSSDSVEVVWGAGDGPRPSFSALAGQARAGGPGLAIVISDLLPPEPPADVRWVAVGDPRVKNVGIVAADLEPHEGGVRLLVTLLNHASAPASVTLRIEDLRIGEERVPLTLTPDEAKAVVRLLPLATTGVDVWLSAPDGDALRADDGLTILRERPRWAIDADLPPAHRDAAQSALQAVLGVTVPVGKRAELRNVEHWVTSGEKIYSEERRDLVLVVDPAGAREIHLPSGVDRSELDSLSSAGLDLVVAVDATEVPGEDDRLSGFKDLVWRDIGGLQWPVVSERGSIFVTPDITRGSPPIANTPFWPLLVDAVVRRFDGTALRFGLPWRKGLLDPASTRLGRVAKPFDAAWLAAVPPRERASEHPLRPWLVALGLAALAALWLARAVGRVGTRAPEVAVSRVG